MTHNWLSFYGLNIAWWQGIRASGSCAMLYSLSGRPTWLETASITKLKYRAAPQASWVPAAFKSIFSVQLCLPYTWRAPGQNPERTFRTSITRVCLPPYQCPCSCFFQHSVPLQRWQMCHCCCHRQVKSLQSLQTGLWKLNSEQVNHSHLPRFCFWTAL